MLVDKILEKKVQISIKAIFPLIGFYTRYMVKNSQDKQQKYPFKDLVVHHVKELFKMLNDSFSSGNESYLNPILEFSYEHL